MALIAVGGFQHETNTFAPTRADYGAFEAGGGWPGAQFGQAIEAAVAGANIPAAGALEHLHAQGHKTVGLAWAAASPSAHVTEDAFERIAGEILRRLRAPGPALADPADFSWTRLRHGMRLGPLGPAFKGAAT